MRRQASRIGLVNVLVDDDNGLEVCMFVILDIPYNTGLSFRSNMPGLPHGVSLVFCSQ